MSKSPPATNLIKHAGFRPAACCVIVLLAPFLGGSTERWSQGIVLLLLAALVFLYPPRTWGQPLFAGVMLFFIALAVPSFLPAAWFAVPLWRQEFLRAGIQAGSLLSPQPWISFECVVLLLAGILWIYWLTLQEWTPGERRWMTGVFVAGAAVLAAVALVTFYGGWPVSFWHSERGFGPFPNRNQSGDFFAISGILAVACACESFRGKKYSAIWFVLAAAVIGAALVVSYSRAGVILFFTGSILWVASLGLVSRSMKLIAISASLLMALAAAFLLFGGATLERFQGSAGVTWGFRRLITQRCVFGMIHASPWCGIGLGNFEGVFAFFRKESAMESRIIHPESDWLWLWSEMGLPAVLVVLAGVVILSRRVVPLARGTGRRLRLAAACSALVFAVHGLVDVSGHRLGSALPGLFVLGLALNNPAPLRENRENRRARAGFRLIAILPGIVGAVWFCAVLQGRMLPGEIGVASNRQRAVTLVSQQQYPAAVAVTTQALAWAPLDWQLYFTRGMAGAYNWRLQSAREDFQRANLLESTSPLTTFDEGRIWLSCAPLYAVSPWRETLRRCPPQDAGPDYDQMLGYASGNPALRRALHSLANGRFDLELIYMGGAAPEEVKAYINNVLAFSEFCPPFARRCAEDRFLPSLADQRRHGGSHAEPVAKPIMATSRMADRRGPPGLARRLRRRLRMGFPLHAATPSPGKTGHQRPGIAQPPVVAAG